MGKFFQNTIAEKRKSFYNAKDPPYVFLCYIDAVYVASARVHGIAEDNLLGHRAIGFFGNVNEWTVE